MFSRRHLLLVLLICTACDRRDNQQKAPAKSTASARNPSAPISLPREKSDSIQIEGAWQPLKLRLAKPASSIPFLTYVPEDMIAESASSDEGEAHYFYANFGGRRNDQAFLLVFVLPRGTVEQDAVRLARAFRDSRTRSGFVVKTDLRRHGDRFYYIGEQYPAEYGDGFGPRSKRIQDEWQWLD